MGTFFNTIRLTFIKIGDLKAMKKIFTKAVILMVILTASIYSQDDQTCIIAARDGDIATVQKYINAGGNVNALNPYGGTAIMFASRAGHTEIVKLLIDAKANLDIQGRYAGTTALMWAAQYGSLDIVKLLIEAKANINLKNNSEQTALTLANENGNMEIVNILKKAGAK